MHFQFTHGTFDFWTRYTRGGYMNINQMRNMYRPPIGTSGRQRRCWKRRPGTAGDYQQLTYFASKVFEVSDAFQVSAIASYDFYDFIESRFNATTTILPSREEEVYARIMGQYTPEDRHAMAFGYEHSREMFGLDTPLTNQSHSRPASRPHYQPLGYQHRFDLCRVPVRRDRPFDLGLQYSLGQAHVFEPAVFAAT